MSETILQELQGLSEPDYARFLRRLLPNLPAESILGVRSPCLRQLARSLAGTAEAEALLQALPHRFHEENMLHGFLIERLRGFDAALCATEAFLPYINNWATCDSFAPKALLKDPEALLTHIRLWLADGREYVVRFGLGMLQRHFLDERFAGEYLELAATPCSEAYYVRMMQAWFFATALAKQYEAALPYIEQRRLQPWVHAKAIQKAGESRRLPDAHKATLRSLR